MRPLKSACTEGMPKLDNHREFITSLIYFLHSAKILRASSLQVLPWVLGTVGQSSIHPPETSTVSIGSPEQE